MDINGLAMAHAVKKYAHNRRLQQAVGGFLFYYIALLPYRTN